MFVVGLLYKSKFLIPIFSTSSGVSNNILRHEKTYVPSAFTWSGKRTWYKTAALQKGEFHTMHYQYHSFRCKCETMNERSHFFDCTVGIPCLYTYTLQLEGDRSINANYYLWFLSFFIFFLFLFFLPNYSLETCTHSCYGHLLFHSGAIAARLF